MALNGIPWAAKSPTRVGDDEASLVTALAIHEGELIVGGGFNTVNGEVANKLARWDGSQWATLGVGPNNGIPSQPRACKSRGARKPWKRVDRCW